MKAMSVTTASKSSTENHRATYARRGGDIVPVKWSALQVMEAADMIEKHINAAVEPLECAREVAKASLEIPQLPQYVEQRINGLLGEIERAIGGSHVEPVGRLKARLQSIRDSVPKDALEAEEKKSEYGKQQSLV